MICNHFHVLRFHNFCIARAQKPQYTKAKSFESHLLGRKSVYCRTKMNRRIHIAHTRTHKHIVVWNAFTGRRFHSAIVQQFRPRTPFSILALPKAKKRIERKQKKNLSFPFRILLLILLLFSIFGIGSEMKFTFRLWLMFTSTISLRAEILLQQAKKI